MALIQETKTYLFLSKVGHKNVPKSPIEKKMFVTNFEFFLFLINQSKVSSDMVFEKND